MQTCPECEDIGIVTSVIKVEHLEAPTVPVRKFLKSDQWHVHDSTTEVLDVYECSAGHRIEIQTTGKPCWCGWLPLQAQRKRDVDELLEDGIGIAYDESEMVKDRLL